MPRLTPAVLTVAAIAALTVTTSAAITFTATFKSLDAGAVSFFGKKVAALVISNDDSLRMAGEEALARALTERGMQGVATYRMAPKEELRQAATAKPWFERAGIDGVFIIRPVSATVQQPYTSNTWVSASYGTLWGYYGYGWGTVYVFGAEQRQQTSVVVESTVFSVARDQLLWAAVSQTNDARNLRAFIEELVTESTEEMRKQGLAGGERR